MAYETLKCPLCGYDLGVTGTKVEVIEPGFTTERITCSGCGAGLELTISSISEKNVSQKCPVCGTPAD